MQALAALSHSHDRQVQARRLTLCCHMTCICGRHPICLQPFHPSAEHAAKLSADRHSHKLCDSGWGDL